MERAPFESVPTSKDLLPHRLAKRTMAVVLAGGRGSRLEHLTARRCKPALHFGGKYRIVDFVLSNCVNSGVRRVAVLTQYEAQTLIRHVQNGWGFLDGRLGEFIELVPAQQRGSGSGYRGTADAVFQNIDLLRQQDPRYFLVLAADHVYKMDYTRMLADHVQRGADVTVACTEVPLAAASAFGVIAVHEDLRVARFDEKPAAPEPLPGRSDCALASMGIYAFNAQFLFEQLARDAADPDSSHDFGRDIIPSAVQRGCRVVAHRFAESCVNMSEGKPYWRDVGTLDAYWEANMELVKVTPALNLYDRDWPIWTHQAQLPPAKFVFDEDGSRGIAINSMVSGGCVVSGALVRSSVLCSDVRAERGSTIEESVVLPNVEIGRGVILRRAVVEKRCMLSPGLVVGADREADARRFSVSPGGVTLITPEMLGQNPHQRH